MKRDRIFRFCLCLTLCAALAFSVIPLFTQAAEENFVDKAANALRDAMVQRKTEVTYTYESQDWIFSPDAIGEDGTISLPQEEVTAALHKIYKQAIAHTGISNQGDYLRWHIAQCAEHFDLKYIQEGNQLKDFEYTFTFTISYYTTAQQEAEVAAKVQSVLSQLDLANKTDYEKIKAIYDYICDHVVYDNDHLSDPGYNLQYTAYAALLQGTSVCQGYSSLFYRMALEAGVDNRVIIGQSQGQHHAWNIVKLDGVYYNVDSTWDAVMGDYSFFLKTSSHMEDHEADAEHKQLPYPMATTDYAMPEDPQPTTQPQPTTPPATQPAPPVTQPAATTVPPQTTAPEEEPTIPSTTEETNPITTNSSAPTTETQTPTQASTTPTEQPKEEPADTWLLAVGGLTLMVAAAGGAALFIKKRK